MTDTNDDDDDPEFAQRKYGDLAASTKENDKLASKEKETTIGWTKREDRVTVFTANSGFARKLLLHPEFLLDWYETTAPDAVSLQVDAVEYAEHGHDRRKPVYAVRGTLPIGVLNIRKEARKSTGPAAIITGQVYEVDDGD